MGGWLSLAGSIAAFVVGIALVVTVLDSAVRTFVLPRAVAVAYTRAVATGVRAGFNAIARLSTTYEGRDRVMALYGPIVLLVLPATWLAVILGAFTLMFRAVGAESWAEAFTVSGSSLLTLGFERGSSALPVTALSFVEAALGLALLALLIAYLPTIYGTYSRREVQVAMLGVRAGSPPSAVDLLVRAHRIGRLDDLDDVWVQWQLWFAELSETHTSIPIVNFFRSTEPHHSWVTAGGTVLDAASFVLSTVDVPFQPQAGICVRSGFLALRSIATLFGIPHDPDPAPHDPISIVRGEWDEVCDQLAAAGVPLKPNRDEAWRDWSGWRVNYDAVLLGLAGLVMAPYGQWSSDRSASYRRPRLRRSR